MGCVFRRPPVRKLAFRIKFCAATIEAVADLMPNSSAGSTVVGRGIGVRIEKWLLQNCSGKVESVLERKIEGIDRLRSHPPFSAIDRATDLGELMMVFPFVRTPCVARRIVPPDHQAGIITPYLRVTDTDAQSFELGFGLRLCRRRHPAQAVDATIKSGEKIVNQPLHCSLGRRWEIFRDINFTGGVAEISVDAGDGALPTFALLWNPLECPSIKAEMQVVIAFRKIDGVPVDRVEGQPFLPGLERLAHDQG